MSREVVVFVETSEVFDQILILSLCFCEQVEKAVAAGMPANIPTFNQFWRCVALVSLHILIAKCNQ